MTVHWVSGVWLGVDWGVGGDVPEMAACRLVFDRQTFSEHCKQLEPYAEVLH